VGPVIVVVYVSVPAAVPNKITPVGVLYENTPDPLLYKYPAELANPPIVLRLVYPSCLPFHVTAEVILLSSRVPVHPSVRLTDYNKAVLGVPPKVRVTLVSSTLLRADGVTVGIVGLFSI